MTRLFGHKVDLTDAPCDHLGLKGWDNEEGVDISAHPLCLFTSVSHAVLMNQRLLADT